MSEKVKAHAVIMGNIEVVEEDENFCHDIGLVLVFDSVEDLRKALDEGECSFTCGHPTD